MFVNCIAYHLTKSRLLLEIVDNKVFFILVKAVKLKNKIINLFIKSFRRINGRSFHQLNKVVIHVLYHRDSNRLNGLNAN